VDWISPTSMNFWVSMSDPAYTKAVKVHAEDTVVNGVSGVKFNVVSAQYIGNNGQTYQVLGDFGYGFNNQGVALAANQNGYGLSGFTAVFANDADSIPTESLWLSEDTNYLQDSGVLVSTDLMPTAPFCKSAVTMCSTTRSSHRFTMYPGSWMAS
jgi:hypothetical protein